jgi:hypothetical protein
MCFGRVVRYLMEVRIAIHRETWFREISPVRPKKCRSTFDNKRSTHTEINLPSWTFGFLHSLFRFLIRTILLLPFLTELNPYGREIWESSGRSSALEMKVTQNLARF